MTSWQLTLAAFGGAAVISLLYNIFQEVRSIRRMMNRDRDIPPD